MVSGNKIKIINEFENFILLDSFSNCELGKVKNIYNSKGIKEWVQRIEFFDNDLKEAVILDFYGLKELTKVFSLNEKEFGNQFITICSFFNIQFKEQLKKHAFLFVKNEERLASIALKLSRDGMVYVSIFMIDSGDSRKDPTLFVQGIWKTKSIAIFTNKLSTLSL